MQGGTSPIMTASLLAARGSVLNVQMGGQVGRAIEALGKLPIDLPIGACRRVVRPQVGSTWPLKTQVSTIFRT